MTRPSHILVVAAHPQVGEKLSEWFDGEGYDVEVVSTFAAAKRRLEGMPDLVFAELKLGEYNGLHVALRARAAGIHAIVLGPRDPAFESEAAALNATYLGPLLKRQELLGIVDRLLHEASGAGATPVYGPLGIDGTDGYADRVH